MPNQELGEDQPQGSTAREPLPAPQKQEPKQEADDAEQWAQEMWPTYPHDPTQARNK